MSRLTRRQAELTAVDARIAEIVVAYPALAKVKSYSQGFGAISTTYQDFGPLAAEYRMMLDRKEWLEGEIDELTDGDDGGSSVASFRNPEA